MRVSGSACLVPRNANNLYSTSPHGWFQPVVKRKCEFLFTVGGHASWIREDEATTVCSHVPREGEGEDEDEGEGEGEGEEGDDDDDEEGRRVGISHS